MALRLPLPRLGARAADVFQMLRDAAGRRRLWRALRVRLSSRRVAIGLRRDLRTPFVAPAAKLALVVRPLQPGDDLTFLDPDPGLSPQAAAGRLTQRLLLGANLPTCWVAADPNGSVCYMQWLIVAGDEARVRARWGDLFPALEPDAALLEGAYTAESHRGQGIMSHAMAKIAAAAQQLGAQQVITFVDHTNAASLKGCEKAGFVPYIERRETWFLFRRRIRFAPLRTTAGQTYSTRTSSP